MSDEVIGLVEEIRVLCRAIRADMRDFGTGLDRLADQLHQTNTLSRQAFEIGRQTKNRYELMQRLNDLLRAPDARAPHVEA